MTTFTLVSYSLPDGTVPDLLCGYLCLLWEEGACKRNHEKQEAAHANHLQQLRGWVKITNPDPIRSVNICLNDPDPLIIHKEHVISLNLSQCKHSYLKKTLSFFQK